MTATEGKAFLFLFLFFFKKYFLIFISRVPLTTLKKCEIALERMLMKENSDSSHHPKNPSLPPSSSSSSSSVAPSDPTVPEPKFSNPPQSQSLLDFKMVLSPPATCTNLMDTIQPHPFPTERLPAAKQFYVTGI